MIKKEYQEITVIKDICTNLMTLPLLLFLGQLLSQEPQMRKKEPTPLFDLLESPPSSPTLPHRISLD